MCVCRHNSRFLRSKFATSYGTEKNRFHGYNYYHLQKQRWLAICDIYLTPIHLILHSVRLRIILSDANRLTILFLSRLNDAKKKQQKQTTQTEMMLSMLFPLLIFPSCLWLNISTYYDFSANISDQITVHMCY